MNNKNAEKERQLTNLRDIYAFEATSSIHSFFHYVIKPPSNKHYSSILRTLSLVSSGCTAPVISVKHYYIRYKLEKKS